MKFPINTTKKPNQQKFGLIGENLEYSFSKIIHEKLADYTYDLMPLPRQAFAEFMEQRNFTGINVTIPYKEAVIPYLTKISPNARAIGAVNTILNRNNQLFGYNTDFSGLEYLLAAQQITLTNKNVLILGTGGTAKTAAALCTKKAAKAIWLVSRKPNQALGEIDYATATKLKSAEIIINTTPQGMYPNNEEIPIRLKDYPNLQGVIDVIYNPLNTKLVLNAKKLGLPATGGLEMLVAQAKFAAELFVETPISNSQIGKIYQELRLAQSNLVLIAMPCAGKTTLGKLLATALNKKFVDTDDLIVAKTSKTIKEIFETQGETEFRKLEQNAIQEVAKEHGQVIATGGGVIKNPNNIWRLKQNGIICFINRATNLLVPDQSRPLASTQSQLEKLAAKRQQAYAAACDFQVDNNKTILTAAAKIKEAYYENLSN